MRQAERREKIWAHLWALGSEHHPLKRSFRFSVGRRNPFRRTARPADILTTSFPHGHNEEGWQRGRYGAYYDLETWRRYMSAAGFVEITRYYRPAGLPREQQPWLAGVWRRLAS